MGALRLAVAALMLAVSASATHAAEPPSLHRVVTEVHPDTITYFEPLIRMPSGAQPLAEYDRYYALRRINDRNVVQGVLLLRSAFGDIDRRGMEALMDRANVYRGAPEDLPVITDGGCAVVTLYFDTHSLHFLQLEAETRDHLTAPAICNGDA